MVDFLFGDVEFDDVSWDKTMTTEVAPVILDDTAAAFEAAELGR